MSDFAGYERETFAVVTKTRHTVNARINSTVDEVISSLNNIPPGTRLSMVLDDEEEYGTLIFEE